MRIALACLVVGLLVPRTAAAGRTFYGRLYGTEVMPERGVELQTWISDENNQGPLHARETSLWWGPLIGITDQLELALPVEMAWEVADGTDPSFSLQRFGAEARYRFVTQDPVDAPPFAPLLRVALKRDVEKRFGVIGEADLVASYEAGALHALVDIGFVAQVESHSHHEEIRPGGGVSVRAVGDLRVGAEVYSELSFDAGSESWVVVGPNLSWTHGRFWFSGMFGIGVYNIKVAPRVVWGIAF